MPGYPPNFAGAVERAFETDQDLLATIHFRSEHPLLRKLKGSPGAELFVLDEKNRDSVFEKVKERLGA